MGGAKGGGGKHAREGGRGEGEGVKRGLMRRGPDGGEEGEGRTVESAGRIEVRFPKQMRFGRGIWRNGVELLRPYGGLLPRARSK